jgi:hypothetical protein
MPGENKIVQQKLLIVEGSHERDFFQAWFARLNILDVQVQILGGKTLLKQNLLSLQKDSDFPSVTSLVIVRDADENPIGAFQSVISAIHSAVMPEPNAPWQFTDTGMPRICVVVLPTESEAGALEELLLRSVEADPISVKAVTYIDDAVAALTAGGVRPPPPLHRLGKARVYAYLATFEYPDRDQGKAAGSGVWKFDHPALERLKSILLAM